MIAANNVSDQTALIRELKHSERIKEEKNRLVQMMEEYKSFEYNDLRTICTFECNFLFTYYTDIFNRILKQEINLSLFDQFLTILQQIENGEVNQHEASVHVGMLLKEIYVDSALKKAKKLEAQFESSSSSTPKPAPKSINYSQYKQTIKEEKK